MRWCPSLQGYNAAVDSDPPRGLGYREGRGDYNSWAVDCGGQYDIAGFEFAGGYCVGKGVGTAGLFVNSGAGVLVAGAIRDCLGRYSMCNTALYSSAPSNVPIPVTGSYPDPAEKNPCPLM